MFGGTPEHGALKKQKRLQIASGGLFFASKPIVLVIYWHFWASGECVFANSGLVERLSFLTVLSFFLIFSSLHPLSVILHFTMLKIGQRVMAKTIWFKIRTILLKVAQNCSKLPKIAPGGLLSVFVRTSAWIEQGSARTGTNCPRTSILQESCCVLFRQDEPEHHQHHKPQTTTPHRRRTTQHMLSREAELGAKVAP